MSSWKILTYLNVTILNDKLDMISSIYKRSVMHCDLVKKENQYFVCKQPFDMLNTKIAKLIEKEETIESLVGHKKVKRGLFNAVGTVFKTIFGTLDNSDAEYFESAINKVMTDERTYSDLLKEQIQVVKSTITNFNESINILRTTEFYLNENVEKLEKFANKTIKKLNDLALNELISEHVTLLVLLTTELDEEFDNVINAILFSKKNVLHPSIINPINLINEINKHIHLIPKGLTIPIDNSIEYSHIMNEILELKVYYKNGKIIFILDIPLTESVIFDIYHIVPLPMPHRNHLSFAYIQPSYEYLAVSKITNKYIQFNNIENNCINMFDDKYLCKDINVYTILDDAICEIVLLIKRPLKLPENCNSKLMIGNMEIIHKLNNNKWIIITTEKKLINVICNEKESVDDKYILGTNIITLNGNCQAYIDSYRLITNNIMSTNYEILIPKINIVDDDCCKESKLNISHEYLNLKSINLNNINLDNLKVISHTLDQMNNKINDAQDHPALIRYPSVFTSIIFTIGGFILLYVLYKLKRKCFKRESESNCLVKVINTCYSGVQDRQSEMVVEYDPTNEGNSEVITIRPSNLVSNQNNQRILRSGRRYNLSN